MKYDINEFLREEVKSRWVLGLFCRPDGSYAFDRRLRTDTPGFNPRVSDFSIIGPAIVDIDPEFAEELIRIKKDATIGGEND